MVSARFVVSAVATMLALVNSAIADETFERRARAGQIIFELCCAICHGRDAEGDGPIASHLNVPAPDLTLLARRSGGV